MSLETVSVIKQYSGNGVTTAFSYPYKFLANGDLVVILTDSDGLETTQTITTHYSVSGAGEDAGGTVTMVTAPASGETLTIYRDPTATQSLDLRENDSAPAEEIEKAFDRLTMLVQRINEVLGNTVSLSDGFVDAFTLTLPTDLATASVALVTNATGDGWAVGPTVTEISNAQTYATNAASSATASAASATASAASATAAASSATSAAASATAAQNAVSSSIWNDVVFITNADSPYTIDNTHRGKLIAVDTSSGNVSITMPTIAGLDLSSAYVVGIKKTTSDGNSVTVSRASTDTIDGATSKTISVADSGATFIPDTDPAPDEWTTADFGSSGGNLTIDNFSGNGSTTGFTLSVDPGSENNTFVYIEGVYQQKDTYSVSGTTLTFTTAPPSGTGNIEVSIGTLLSIGTPSDGTVTDAKTAFTQTTVQRFTSGSGTYTTPSGVKRIVVKMVGGGGGGAGGGTAGGTAAGDGGDSTFGSSLLTAGGGTKGAYRTNTATGGTNTINSPAVTILDVGGQDGFIWSDPPFTGTMAMGGVAGGSTALGGGGRGGPYNGAASDGITNTGGGGGGGGNNNTSASSTGTGGGGGGYLEASISSPSATYAYAVGAGGTAGGAGTSGVAGGAGAAGVIVVEEYYV